MATYTANFNLKKPGQDEFYNVEDFNDNAEIIDTQLKANEIAHGTGNFTGDGGETTIPHGLELTPSVYYATPIENPNGFLGESWIRVDDTNLYVGNSGSFTGAFLWIAKK